MSVDSSRQKQQEQQRHEHVDASHWIWIMYRHVRLVVGVIDMMGNQLPVELSWSKEGRKLRKHQMNGDINFSKIVPSWGSEAVLQYFSHERCS